MIAVLQRVFNASVIVDGVESGKIGKGLYILLGVEKGDDEEDSILLADKICKLRIFTDENDKMNLSLKDVSGEILVVSNFTLNANYKHGNRPDFLNALEPAEANRLYHVFASRVKANIGDCQMGVFGADMRTEMATDGPVTIVMDSAVLRRKGNA